MIPVIIPFYGRSDQLERCIEHLRCQTVSVEIFVRDNNVNNVFFTVAVNEGILRYLDTDCQYMIVLKQDMYLDPTAVEAMVEFLETHPRAGIAGPLEHTPSQPEGWVLAGGLDAFPLGKHACIQKARLTADRQVHWANGSCMILRKEMIRRIGLMDENYKLICSDSDYCFTGRSRGWEVWVVAGAYGVHEHGISAGSSNPSLELMKVNDILYFGAKWLTGDLYRRISFEGQRLGPNDIQELIARYRQVRASLLQSMQGATAQVAANTGH
ncbi:MAG: glycosyltransferase family 2 protein [Sedimentisphaerales bacterium]|jgi:GT2 family glycosyltransferase|nr:glycosyltransferase family 2 protein [Sedimentisphaerales bacterium]